MYGQSVFTDEVLKTVEKELVNYVNNENWTSSPSPCRSTKMMPAALT